MANILLTPVSIDGIKRGLVKFRDKLFPYRGLPKDPKYRKKTIAEALNLYLHDTMPSEKYEKIMVIPEGPDSAYIFPRLDDLMCAPNTYNRHIRYTTKHYRLESDNPIYVNLVGNGATHASIYKVKLTALFGLDVKDKFIELTRKDCIARGFYAIGEVASNFADIIIRDADKLMDSIKAFAPLANNGIPSSLFRITYSTLYDYPLIDICPALFDQFLYISRQYFVDDETFSEYKKHILDAFANQAWASSKEVDALYPVITVCHPESWLKQYMEQKHAAEVKAKRDAECAATIKLINDTLNASLPAAKAKKESDDEAD
jgi:hypothetical protein